GCCSTACWRRSRAMPTRTSSADGSAAGASQGAGLPYRRRRGPDAAVRAPWTVTAVPSVVHDHLGLVVDVGDVGLLELALQAVVDLVLIAGRVAELLDSAVGHPGVLDLALHEVRVRLRAPVDRGALEVDEIPAAGRGLLLAHRVAEVAVRPADLLVLVGDRLDDGDLALRALDLGLLHIRRSAVGTVLAGALR